MTPAISVYTETCCEHKHMRIPVSLLRGESPLEFRPVTFRDMPLIWRYLSREGSRTCDFSYGGLLIWTPLFGYEYAVFKDTLFIRGRLEGDFTKYAFSLPVGNLSLSHAVSLLKEWCEAHQEKLRFSAIPETALDSFMALGPSQVRDLPDWADYLYDIGSLASLSGKKMQKKRNHVNKFENTYPDHEFLPLTAAGVDDARHLLARLESDADDFSDMAMTERRQCAMTLELMATHSVPMEGGILYAGGSPVAFTVGDIKADTLFVHIEKADRNVPGAYEAVNKYFAAHMARKYPALRYVNREDDAGDSGLRRAKESYHPMCLLRKYDITF